MSGPDHIFSVAERTRSGTLTTRALSLIAARLAKRGFVLLPSDTCYAIALVPHDEDSRTFINRILRRPPDTAVSLAFSGLRHVREYLDLNVTALQILEQFTPGPVTVVCPAGKRARDFAAKSAGSTDLTLAVRIPDSTIERDVANCAGWPVTTTAVRDANGNPVQSFEEALELITETSTELGNPGWYAIEGNGDFRSTHSTVVRVREVSNISLIREGDVPFEAIREAAKWLPASYLEEWV
ncbi:Sua5/YciO/YrdC/YwlC family protein [Micromonospora gifhornensis]|uniref:L-threonylcarbamoyladenylate synthase n=1 Tax=Micromonospora gifhornensis TaxID=84594 RepID=UPI003456C1B3